MFLVLIQKDEKDINSKIIFKNLKLSLLYNQIINNKLRIVHAWKFYCVKCKTKSWNNA